MKHFFLIVVFVCFGSNAQTIVASYNNPRNQTEVYYKDTFNDLNKFAGTWLYTNGTTSLQIMLKKETMSYDYFNLYYEDLLVGEYKYDENGSEKINTLPQISSTDVYNHNINGGVIVGPDSQYCKGCTANDRKVFIGFHDPTRTIDGYEPHLLIERVDSNGIQKIKIKFWSTGSRIAEEGITPAYTSYNVPFGEYILIKQP